MKDPTASALSLILPLILFLTISLGGWFVCWAGWEQNAKAFKMLAVEYGAAEWRASADGTTTFHWKEKK